MKKQLFTPIALIAGAIGLMLMASCQKNYQAPVVNRSSGLIQTAAFTNAQAIALSSSSGDTIFAVNVCRRGLLADTVAFASLPDTIGKYLTANYTGYTFKAAFKIQNAAATVQGYVVAIKFNNNPVALEFNASGIFTAVLEQRQGPDLYNGPGWHAGGRFGDRDGQHPDSVALSTLPAAITGYFTSNYPKDTLQHAFVNRDTSYLVISKDTGIYATVLTKAGKLVNRTEIYPHVISQTKLTQAQLPAAISTYLTTTYPGFVFENAVEVKLNGSAKAYIVIIEDNTTKYIVGFDANGNFVKAHTIR